MNQILFSGEIEDISLDKKKNIDQLEKEKKTILNQQNTKTPNTDNSDIDLKNMSKNANIPIQKKLREIQVAIIEGEDDEEVDDLINEEEIKVDKEETKKRIDELNNQIQIAEQSSVQDNIVKEVLLEKNNSKKTSNKMEGKRSKANKIEQEIKTVSIKNRIISKDKNIFKSNIERINSELSNIDVSAPLDELVSEKIKEEEIKKRHRNTMYAKILLQREKKRDYNIKKKI